MLKTDLLYRDARQAIGSLCATLAFTVAAVLVLTLIIGAKVSMIVIPIGLIAALVWFVRWL